MAKLEELIKDVRDDRLRTEIAAEVASLKATMKFGLVFEEHIPETIQLPGLTPKLGNRVVRRGGDQVAVFVVKAVEDGDWCSIVLEQGGGSERVNTGELVVVKRFGEPIYPTLTSVARLSKAAELTL